MRTAFRQPPARAIADRLHSAAIHLLRRLRVEDKAMGLTGPRASALSVLVFRGSLTMSQLAEAEQVRRPTITRLVDGLERRGLVRRVSDAEDGRVQLVEATAAGEGPPPKGTPGGVVGLDEGNPHLPGGG